MPLKKPRGKITFEVHLAEHCNLNCAGCAAFSSIAEPTFIDIEEFKRDFKRLGELFNHECSNIRLEGGEPLLNPNIIEFMKIARENFTQGEIFIFTNGILLPQQGEDFWQACRDNNINIVISAYPIKIDTDKISAMADKFGIKAQWAWGEAESTHDTFAICKMDLSGKQDINKNYAVCPRGNDCIMLDHGRLYTCTFAPTVKHFNKKFNTNIEITENDSVDIYKEDNKDVILKKLSQPIPACRYCWPPDKRPTFKWHVTKGEISEWGC